MRYDRSAEWVTLKASTQRSYRGTIERLREDHGSKPLNKLQKRHIRAMIAALAAQPAKANKFLRIIRMLMRFAVEEEMIVADPTFGIRKIKTDTTGFHAWTDSEITQFLTYWAPGTKQYLAFCLLYFTGQRRSDVIRLGRQHMDNARLRIDQQKTGARGTIPIHPTLAGALEVAPLDNLTFLVTDYGRPFTAAGFGNWFRKACNAAGLPQCSANGLRKAWSRHLAEAGCSTKEIAAWTLHASMREVDHYTKSASQERLANAALERTLQAQTFPNPMKRFGEI